MVMITFIIIIKDWSTKRTQGRLLTRPDSDHKYKRKLPLPVMHYNGYRMGIKEPPQEDINRGKEKVTRELALHTEEEVVSLVFIFSII